MINQKEKNETLIKHQLVDDKGKSFYLNYLNEQEIEDFLKLLEERYQFIKNEEFVYGEFYELPEAIVLSNIKLTIEKENGIFSYGINRSDDNNAKIIFVNRSVMKDYLSKIIIERHGLNENSRYTMPKTIRNVIMRHEIEGFLLNEDSVMSSNGIPIFPNILINSDQVMFKLETLNPILKKEITNTKDELSELMISNVKKNIFKK